MTGEGSGRAAIHYGRTESVIDGVRTTDSPGVRPGNFNCRKYVKTPFGWLCCTGVLDNRIESDD